MIDYKLILADIILQHFTDITAFCTRFPALIRIELWRHLPLLYTTSFLAARRYASAGTSYGPVSVSVCLPVSLSVPVCRSVTSLCSISKRVNESSWFMARELPSTYPTLY